MATRKPVKVLPVPVGDATKTSWPVAINGHAARCGSVGPPGNRVLNQARTAEWKRSSTGSTTGSTVGLLAASIVIGPSHQTAVTIAIREREHPGDLVPAGQHHLGRRTKVPVVTRRSILAAEHDH